MKFKIEFELEPVVIKSPNLSEEIIRDQLIKTMKVILHNDASNGESEFSEVWIDTSNDGDGSQYNLYHLKVVK